MPRSALGPGSGKQNRRYPYRSYSLGYRCHKTRLDERNPLCKMEKVNKPTPAEANAATIEQELDWLSELITARLALHANTATNDIEVWDIDPPTLDDDDSIYASIIEHYDFGFAERLVL